MGEFDVDIEIWGSSGPFSAPGFRRACPPKSLVDISSLAQLQGTTPCTIDLIINPLRRTLISSIISQYKASTKGRK
jgi:hypothetical protein